MMKVQAEGQIGCGEVSPDTILLAGNGVAEQEGVGLGADVIRGVGGNVFGEGGGGCGGDKVGAGGGDGREVGVGGEPEEQFVGVG